MMISAGQVAVITGAASGIGLAMATRFGQLGLKLALADIDGNRLADVAQALQQGGAEVLARPTDVADPADMAGFSADVMARWGGVDILCNNAGIVSPFRPLWENPLQDWDRVLGVNLIGVIHGISQFVPAMVAAGHGHIVNTASMAGLMVVPSNGIYNAAKKAVVAISETLSADLDAAGHDIGVTVLCPGLVETAINSDPAIAALLPDDAVFLKPADVARQVVVAIERRQLYLATHPGSDAMVGAYQQQVLQQVRQVPWPVD